MGRGRKTDKNELPIPADGKKLVQTLKEILSGDFTDAEIYAVLQECDMNADETVQTLLSQGKFHEVKRKRERRKEMKEAQELKVRGSNIGGVTVGVESNVGLAPAQESHNEVGKAANMRENPSVAPSITSSSSLSNAMITMNEQPTCDRKIGAGDLISTSEEISGEFEPAFIGNPRPSEYSSLADVVKLGRPWASFSHTVEETSYTLNDADGRFPKNSQSEEIQVDHDVSSKNHCSEFSESDCLFTGQESTCNVDGASHSDNSSLEVTVFHDLHRQANEHHEVVSGSLNNGIPTTALSLKHLSLGKEVTEVASQSKDTCTVVLPNFIQALNVDCSHLSFGTYNSGASTVKSNLDKASANNHKNLGYFADSLHRELPGSITKTVGSTTTAENHEFLVSSQPDSLRQDINERWGYGFNSPKIAPDSMFKNAENYSSSWSTAISPPSSEFHPSLRDPILDSGAFAVPKAFSSTLPNAAGHVITQHLPAHLHSQPALDPEKLISLNGYSADPQIYPHASASLQPSYQGSNFFRESLADMKPDLQKLEGVVSRSNLPPYANVSAQAKLPKSLLDTFSAIPNQSAIGYNDLLGVQYEANNLAVPQQNDNIASWGYGFGSRTLSDTYYSRLGQGQSLSTYQPSVRDNRYYNLNVQDEKLSAYGQGVPDNRSLNIQMQNQLLSMYQRGIADERYNRQVVDRLLPVSQRGLPSNRYNNLQGLSQQLAQSYATLCSRDAYAALHSPQGSSPALMQSVDDVPQNSVQGSEQSQFNWQNF